MARPTAWWTNTSAAAPGRAIDAACGATCAAASPAAGATDRGRCWRRWSPTAPSARAAGWGRRCSPDAGRPRPAFWAVGLAVAAAAVLLLVLPQRLLDGGFRARGGQQDGEGGESGGPGLLVFRIPALGRQGQPAERVGAVIRGGDGLAFSYRNPPEVGATHLMVFAVDGAAPGVLVLARVALGRRQPDRSAHPGQRQRRSSCPRVCATICPPGR